MRDPRYPVPQDVSLLPIFRALTACHQRADRLMTRFLLERDLTPSQFDALAVLGDSDGLPFKALSRQSLVSGGTLTPVLDRLEGKGLVQRCKDSRDGRQVIVKLTPVGQALYEQIFLPAVDHAQEALKRLTPDEQRQLVGLLGKLADALDRPCSPVTRGGNS